MNTILAEITLEDAIRMCLRAISEGVALTRLEQAEIKAALAKAKS